MRASVGRTRIDSGATIQDQEADSSDDGQRDEFDPENSVRLPRDGKQDRYEQRRDEQGEGLRCAVSQLLRPRDNARSKRHRHEQKASQARRSSAGDRRE